MAGQLIITSEDECQSEDPRQHLSRRNEESQHRIPLHDIPPLIVQSDYSRDDYVEIIRGPVAQLLTVDQGHPTNVKSAAHPPFSQPRTPDKGEVRGSSPRGPTIRPVETSRMVP